MWVGLKVPWHKFRIIYAIRTNSEIPVQNLHSPSSSDTFLFSATLKSSTNHEKQRKYQVIARGYYGHSTRIILSPPTSLLCLLFVAPQCPFIMQINTNLFPIHKRTQQLRKCLPFFGDQDQDQDQDQQHPIWTTQFWRKYFGPEVFRSTHILVAIWPELSWLGSFDGGWWTAFVEEQLNTKFQHFPTTYTHRIHGQPTTNRGWGGGLYY